MRLWLRVLVAWVLILFVQEKTVIAAVDVQQHQFSQIKGKKVEDQDGAKLGKVQDFIIDTRSGRVKYVVIDFGGILGVRSRQKAVPAYVVTTGSAKRDTVALIAKKTAWKRTPLFKQSDLSQLAQSDRARQLSKLYPNAAEVAWPADNPATPTSPTGGDGAASRAVAELRLASDIVSKPLVDRQQQELGTVTDLLVDSSGAKPVLAIASLRARDPAESFAFPIRALTVVPDNRLVLNANPAMLRQAKPFTEQAWQPEMSSTTLLRLGHQTRQREYQLEQSANTQSSPGSSNPDRTLAQRVKEAVETDPVISTAALKELKIVAIQGKVTLRGRVPSSRERKQIERTAREIAGSRNVNNQLIVQKPGQ